MVPVDDCKNDFLGFLGLMLLIPLVLIMEVIQGTVQVTLRQPALR